MIELITVQERNKRTGKMETIVSHGVDTNTGRNVILPCETPQELGAKFDTNHGWHFPDPVEP